MREKKKARLVTIVLAILFLSLSSFSIASNAENIPLSEEGILKIGLDKVRLESSIGVIVFNLTTEGNNLEASGYFTISNTFNTSVSVSCKKVIKLSTVDLNETTGLPRVHHKIIENVYMYPFPTDLWVTLESDKAIIEPFSVYNYRYTIKIPIDIDFNKNKGYLMYLNIGKDLGSATGAQIGINYDYKLFIIFTGEKQGFTLSLGNMLIPIIIIAIITVIIALFALIRRRRHNAPKKENIPKPEPIKTNPNPISKIGDIKSTNIVTSAQIDKLLKDRRI